MFSLVLRHGVWRRDGLAAASAYYSAGPGDELRQGDEYGNDHKGHEDIRNEAGHDALYACLRKIRWLVVGA